jgi:hypothetical protein
LFSGGLNYLTAFLFLKPSWGGTEYNRASVYNQDGSEVNKAHLRILKYCGVVQSVITSRQYTPTVLAKCKNTSLCLFRLSDNTEEKVFRHQNAEYFEIASEYSALVVLWLGPNYSILM